MFLQGVASGWDWDYNSRKSTACGEIKIQRFGRVRELLGCSGLPQPHPCLICKDTKQKEQSLVERTGLGNVNASEKIKQSSPVANGNVRFHGDIAGLTEKSSSATTRRSGLVSADASGVPGRCSGRGSPGSVPGQWALVPSPRKAPHTLPARPDRRCLFVQLLAGKHDTAVSGGYGQPVFDRSQSGDQEGPGLLKEAPGKHTCLAQAQPVSSPTPQPGAIGKNLGFLSSLVTQSRKAAASPSLRHGDEPSLH